MKRLTRNLLERSEQAFMLGLEVFNKPTIAYRIEGFCFFYVNAWELLLKARILDTAGKEQSIFYRKQRGKPRRSLSLRDALVGVIPNENDPVRRNIEVVAELRDQGTHLLIPELEAVYAGVFQAGVINYPNCLQDWFSRTLGNAGTLPLLSLVWDLKHLDPKVIRKRHGSEALGFLQERRAHVEDLESRVRGRQFSIPIDYKLVLTKKPKEADITLGTGPGGAISGQILEVPRDIGSTHPLKQRDAIERIRSRLPRGTRFNQRDFQAVLHKEKVKSTDSSPFHYRIKQTGTHCYSEKLVDMVEKKVVADPHYLGRCRQSYKRHLEQKRRRTPSPRSAA